MDCKQYSGEKLNLKVKITLSFELEYDPMKSAYNFRKGQ